MSQDQLVTAEDLLAKMRAGTKETYDIRLRTLVFPVRILSIDEEIEIRARMKVENMRLGGDEVSLAAKVQKETLKQASHIASGVSVMPDRIWDQLKRDELIYLFNEYMVIVDNVNPSLEQMSPEQFNILVEALKKNTVTASDLSLAQLKGICLAYQDLIQRLDIPVSPMDNTPGGPS